MQSVTETLGRRGSQDGGQAILPEPGDPQPAGQAVENKQTCRSKISKIQNLTVE